MATARPSYIKNKESTAVDDPQLAAKGQQLFDLKAKKRDLEAELKATNVAIGELETSLAEEMASRQVDLFRVKGLGTFFIQMKNHPSITDTEGFIAWLDAHDMGSVAKRSVHPQTLVGMVNQWLREGVALPKAKDKDGVEYDLINNFARATVGTRKA